MEQIGWQSVWQWVENHGLAMTISVTVLVSAWLGVRAAARWFTAEVWPSLKGWLDGIRSDHKEGMARLAHVAERQGETLSELRTISAQTHQRINDVEAEQRDTRRELGALKSEMHARFDRRDEGRQRHRGGAAG